MTPGVAVFEKLHSRAHDGEAFLYAFDLLELDGEDWRPRPLEARKAKLEKLFATHDTPLHMSRVAAKAGGDQISAVVQIKSIATMTRGALPRTVADAPAC
jgi:ATP-dependent DNA ligase